MIINHNMNALNAHRMMTSNTVASGKSMEKLSSGSRINRAGDDAAGLAISEKMRAQIRGLDQASRNSQDAISMVQTAEGALNETQSIIQRMRELSVQSSTDTNTADDRQAIQDEINQLTSEINRIGNTTEFNGMKVLNGDKSATKATGDVTIKADSGVYKSAFALGVTWTGQTGDKPSITDGAGNEKMVFTDTVAGGFEWSKLDTGAAAKVSITKSGDDLVLATGGTLKDSDGDELTINAQKLAFDGTNYSYDADGIKLSISKEDFDSWTDGAKFEVDLATYDVDGGGDEDITAATVGTKSDFTAHTLKGGGSTYGSFTTDITVDNTSSEYIEGVASIKITAAGLDAANGTYKIELLDKDGAAIVTEDFKNAAATTSIAYNDHGINFTFDVQDTAAFTIQKDFNLTETAVTTDESATFQVGANKDQSMSLSFDDMRASSLGLVGTGTGFSASANVTDGTSSTLSEKALDVTTQEGANSAIEVLDNAIKTVSKERSKYGSVQNRLEHTINNLNTSSENLTAAESRIRDVDMAKEMLEFSKNNILNQAAQAMLAQAKQAPQGVLQLLR
ncbi:flagellin [Tepidibacter hydrothermalis]|uniref:Flagellin n=1 Tax=Tepidibacter hydrothermalis TaxID=3036126 RepID=A0ABY8EAU8_9FIRM|nr:flagellin [Tepidibacter hydrothermalis]WFD10038.1 flagellin [Tepidibacter hydrothermalis]